MNNVNGITGFPFIANQQAKILILGSMPSEMSLVKQQYYGHQRNAFWPIMLSLFNRDGGGEEIPYRQRKQLLMQNHIAVWDVLQSCYREGSLDAAIKMDSIKVNDFYDFFSLHKNIKTVCFNGAKAESIYKKLVLSDIENEFGHLNYIKLPSTSPAYAAMSLQQKMTIWGDGLNYNKLNR